MKLCHKYPEAFIPYSDQSFSRSIYDPSATGIVRIQYRVIGTGDGTIKTVQLYGVRYSNLVRIL